MSDIPGITQVGSTVFAAFAAGASWLAVLSNQRESRERQRPNLQASVISVTGAHRRDEQAVSLVILNAGTGVAKSAAFALAVGTEYCANAIGSGFFRYQQTVRVKTEMLAHRDVRGLVMCRDLGQKLWV